jgi:hypothetical protein
MSKPEEHKHKGTVNDGLRLLGAEERKVVEAVQDSLRQEGFRLVATITGRDLAARNGVTAPEDEVVTFFTKQEVNAGKETQNVVIRYNRPAQPPVIYRGPCSQPVDFVSEKGFVTMEQYLQSTPHKIPKPTVGPKRPNGSGPGLT